jgi:geranylgeranyl pyrophosphate synthase
MLSQRWEQVWATAEVDNAYREALRTALPAPAAAAAGQRASPLAALPGLCCAAAGGERGRAEALADAWTLLYRTLHLLDSLEDADEPDALWMRWGSGAAINISTGLLASLGLILSGLEQAGADHTAAQAIRQDFFQTLLRMASGQHADLTLYEPSLEQCWRIAEHKSGVFFALACRVGARLHTAEAARIERFGQFGLRLGILIQIGNDLDGLWPKAGGASDLAVWPRWTLPVAHAMAVLDAAERERLRAALRAAPSDAQAEAEARRLIISAGAVFYLVAEGQRHQQLARAALEAAALPSQARDELLALLHRITPMEQP